MEKQNAGICGISELELTTCFQPEIQALADRLRKTYDATLVELKKHYNGYHFCEDTEGIYNPFSLLNSFRKGKIKKYWFETGTPTFLIKMLKNIEFDIKHFENDIKIPADSITEYRVEYIDPVPLLYQSGYLTIKNYDATYDEYTLCFPNEEVKYGFLNELMHAYMPENNAKRDFYAANFVRDLSANDIDGFMTRMKAFFASIPYDLNNKTEKHFQTIFYILFQLMGQFVEIEQHSATGRADAVVITHDTVYILEFKITDNSTVEEALQQIDDKGYTTPYIAGNKKIIKIGIEFSIEARGIKRWKKDDNIEK
jgi:hypothetical protein